ncbi:MAG: thioester domain-containing protein, partial [Clostridia bacterium]
MSKTKIKKIIGGLLLIVVLITTFQNTIYAVSMNQRVLIDNYGNCDYTLQYKRSDGVWSYVTCVFAGYSENGKVYPAYCVNKGLDGVGEKDAYNVDLTKLMDDYRLWRVAINGYPYKTPSEMGVENEYDAFLATKQAIYSILYNTDVESYYRGGNARGVKVYNAIKNMVNEGRNGTYTPQDANVTINKVGGLKEETNYYSQEYSVSSRVSMSTYTIINTLNMPSGAYIADL